MIKACIFDLDGTLADTIESIAWSCNEALAVCGLGPLPVKDYQYYAGDGAKVLVERALKAAGDSQLKHFEKVYDVYSEFFRKDCTYKVSVFDGMFEALEAMKQKGIRLAVLSNKPHDRAVDVVNKLFGENYFDMVQGQTDSIPRKPSPAGALKIAEKFGVRPDQCMYVGDTNTDMQTGNAAGMYTIGVLWGFRTREELEENHAHDIAEHPAQLVSLLNRKIRLVVTDVDGTLIQTGVAELDPAYHTYISALLDRGIAVAAASGRQIQSLQHIFKENADRMYLIGENGGQMVYHGSDVEFKAIDRKMLAALIQDIKRIGRCEILMSCPKVHYVEAKDADLYHHLTEIVHNHVCMVDDFSEVDEPVCKIAFYREGGIEDVVDYFKKQWGDKLHVAVSAASWLDFNRPDVNKGEAVKKVQGMLGISEDETMAFGDSDNDLEMLGCAKFNYAKTGARPAVKAGTRFSTASVLDQLKDLIEETGGLR